MTTPDVCGRLAMAPMGDRPPHPVSCQLDHGHRGAHEARIKRANDWYGSWHWHNGARSDRGPGLADQILGATS